MSCRGGRFRAALRRALPAVCAVSVGMPLAPLQGQSPPPGGWRFPPGETAVYDVTFGPIRVGQGRLRVEAVDTVAAIPAYRVAFEIEGGPFFYKIDDRTVSWVALEPFRSVRFEQILREGDYRRHRRYLLDHDALTYTRQEWNDSLGVYVSHAEERNVPMPEGALDEISFLYLVRSLPLEVGRTYRFDRYFEKDGNPVLLQVLRREQVRVAAGRYDVIVVRPIIRAGGMFGEEGEAEVYLTDDDRRLIVMLRTKMKVGELSMYLKEYRPGD